MSTDLALHKDSFVLGPISDGANATNVRKILLSVTAFALELPKDWQGGFVTMKCVGANCMFYFSTQNTVLPDYSLAAQADGHPDKQLGYLISDGETLDVRVPLVADPTMPAGVGTPKMYLCMDADAAGTLWVRKSSD